MPTLGAECRFTVYGAGLEPMSALANSTFGVIYRPESELASHYFEAELPRQFNEYIWIDRTCAVVPLPAGQIRGVPDTYPFGV